MQGAQAAAHFTAFGEGGILSVVAADGRNALPGFGNRRQHLTCREISRADGQPHGEGEFVGRARRGRLMGAATASALKALSHSAAPISSSRRSNSATTHDGGALQHLRGPGGDFQREADSQRQSDRCGAGLDSEALRTQPAVLRSESPTWKLPRGRTSSRRCERLKAGSARQLAACGAASEVGGKSRGREGLARFARSPRWSSMVAGRRSSRSSRSTRR